MSMFYEPYDVLNSRSRYYQGLENFMNPFFSPKRVQVDEKEAFQVSVDVQQFKPSELSVKVTDENVVTVEGKHPEKRDEHGTISRHFVRKYDIPPGFDTTKIESKLSSDGILTILVGRYVKEKKNIEVPIQQTYTPMKTMQKEAEAAKKTTEHKIHVEKSNTSNAAQTNGYTAAQTHKFSAQPSAQPSTSTNSSVDASLFSAKHPGERIIHVQREISPIKEDKKQDETDL